MGPIRTHFYRHMFKIYMDTSFQFKEKRWRQPGQRPLCIRTDKGNEFCSKHSKVFFKNKNILHMRTQTTEIKASYAKRFIKTLKNRIYRYFTHAQTYKYIEKLQDFVDSYNNTPHGSTGRKPSSVIKDNKKQVWFDQYAVPK